MHFEGQQTVDAPIEAAWALLMDPHQVAECAPGYKSMEVLSPERFKPTVAVGVGPVKATFVLDVTLVDVRAPRHAGLLAHGVAVGSAVDVQSGMDLEPVSDTVTSLTWTMDLNVSGTLMSVGARFLDGTTRKLTERFFACVGQKLATPAATASVSGPNDAA